MRFHIGVAVYVLTCLSLIAGSLTYMWHMFPHWAAWFCYGFITATMLILIGSSSSREDAHGE